MNTTVGSDNGLEDYFLHLLINKHVIQREIHEILDVIEASPLHPDYQFLLKKVLFGENNFYIQNWGTLEGSLMEIIHTGNIRDNDVERYGIILQSMLKLTEEVFDVDDEHMHLFLLSEAKETIEHKLIILMKKVLDFIETNLESTLLNFHQLEKPIENDVINQEFQVLKNLLQAYSGNIIAQEEAKIHELKLEVASIHQHIQKQQKNIHRMRTS